MNDIFSKLNSLKSIEPSETWVVEAKKKVLSEAPFFVGKESILENTIDKRSNLGFNLQDLFRNLSFKKLAIPAFSLVFMLSTGVFTLSASESSLPGDFLYSVKMINEDMTLVVASKDKKAEIEMKHAGKRLEEIAEISKKTSDVEQQKKIGQLMERFEKKIESANENLTKIDKSGEKTKIAKVINIQSEKYTEVLTKTVEDLPAVVKDEILEGVSKAIDSNEKIYLNSLAVIVKEVEKEAEEIEEEITSEADETEDSEEAAGAGDGKEESLDNEDNDLEDGSDDNISEDDVLGIEVEDEQPDSDDSVSGENLGDGDGEIEDAEEADEGKDAEDAVSGKTGEDGAN